jgi:hypothetical protein
MSNTTNYGWNIPDNTDLVKDGALAIRTLGSAIDTSMNTALGTRKAGMVLLNTTSFSGVASQSINDVFSATYNNYKIVLNMTSASENIYLKVRVSGTDLTTGYATVRNLTTTSAALASYYNYNDTLINLGVNGSSGNASSIEIFSPFLAQRTQVFSLTTGDNSTVLYQEIVNASVKNTNSYTGFTIIPASGTITGTVRVYGYNN